MLLRTYLTLGFMLVVLGAIGLWIYFENSEELDVQGFAKKGIFSKNLTVGSIAFQPVSNLTITNRLRLECESDLIVEFNYINDSRAYSMEEFCKMLENNP